MSTIFVGDEHHRSFFQEAQVSTLSERVESLKALYWSTEGMQIFKEIDDLFTGEKLTLIASRHGAIPVVHWTARNQDKVKKQILLHPSLHLNLPGMEAPVPHFVSTMVVCHSKVVSPNHEEIATFAGKLFHEYSVHLTTEPAELTSTLKLLSV